MRSMIDLRKQGGLNQGITLIALVITIIVLLILAGVSIATLTGENGILNKSTRAKAETDEANAKEKVQMAVMSSFGQDGLFDREEFPKETENLGGSVVSADENTIVVEMGEYEATVDAKTGQIINFESLKGIRPKVEINLYQVNGTKIEEGIYSDKVIDYDRVVITVNVINEESLSRIDEITVKNDKGTLIAKESTIIGTGKESYKTGNQGTYTITVRATTDEVQKEKIIKITVRKAPEQWTLTTTGDSEWYSYGNAKIATPKLKGEMIPIKYIGETQTGNKWANAMTANRSMFVWVPRYAYKITRGYHSATAGTIEVAFVSTSNIFLNGETGKITEDPSEEGAGTTKWLVHPAFTSNASNGGGFGQLEGFWVGKFETCGVTLAVFPGVSPRCDFTANEFFHTTMDNSFGESVSLNSHMIKNSEWGATVYLGHSQYGTNGKQIEPNSGNGLYTGGNSDIKIIYTANKTQSTTHNASGVYDMNRWC